MNARTIYIVDDNNEFRQSTRWWLEGAGYDVVDFADPTVALRSLTADGAAHAQACVLLDLRMPRVSGLDLHDRLRESGVGLPIVYMTGHGDVPLAVQAMQKGAVSFLEKPFDEQALEAALARAFERGDATPPSADATITSGPWCRLIRSTARSIAPTSASEAPPNFHTSSTRCCLVATVTWPPIVMPPRRRWRGARRRSRLAARPADSHDAA